MIMTHDAITSTVCGRLLSSENLVQRIRFVNLDLVQRAISLCRTDQVSHVNGCTTKNQQTRPLPGIETSATVLRIRAGYLSRHPMPVQK